MQAVVLVGGAGTRLRPLTDTRPKPMMPLVNRPFVAHQLDLLRRHGVTDVIFSCGYRPDALRAHFGEGDGGRACACATSSTPSRSARPGRSRTPRTLLDDAPVPGAERRHPHRPRPRRRRAAPTRRRAPRATIVLTPVEDPSAFGLVRLHDDASVEAFVEKPAPEELRPGEPFRINAGTYLLAPSVLDGIPAGRAVLDRARGVPGPRRPGAASTASRATPTGATSARPARTWPRTTTC